MSGVVMADRGGFRLATRVTGQGEGAPWLVLSNSLGASMMMWDDQLELLGRTYRVLSYDTRGHGASDAPTGPYSFDDLVGDVIALMDRRGIAKATYMGLSLGGMTGLGLALKHPARFERIVCCDARADNPEPFVKSWDDRIAAIDANGLSAILAPTMERWFVESWRTANPARLKAFETEFLKTSAEGYKGCAAAIKTLNYLKDLGSVKVPVLYVCGEQDMGAPIAVMGAMSAATPGSALAGIPNAAHLPNVDNAAVFNRAIAPFLRLA
jgi:3-oxoadipate enol-lactonase